MLASGRIDIYSIFYLAVQEHSLSACHINSFLKWAGIVQFQGLCPGPNSALIDERILEKFWQVEFLFSWQWGTWTRSLLGETTVAQFSLPLQLLGSGVGGRLSCPPGTPGWGSPSLLEAALLSAHLVPLLLSPETSLSASIIFKPHQTAITPNCSVSTWVSHMDVWLTMPHLVCLRWFESQPLSSQSWNRMTSKPTNPHHLPLFSPSAYMTPSKHYDLVETLKPLTPSLSHYPVVPHVHSPYSS